ncbi:MAG: hypothetical protein LBS63_02745, partial [Prevotellaceae bacterium]|nr:hypothetical protein [Prevotellaceae bacterium]
MNWLSNIPSWLKPLSSWLKPFLSWLSNILKLPNSALDTASPYTLDFTEAQRGKWVYACLAWQNPKGEKG